MIIDNLIYMKLVQYANILFLIKFLQLIHLKNTNFLMKKYGKSK